MMPIGHNIIKKIAKDLFYTMKEDILKTVYN